jgi:3-deoxy-D-manno-octulosonate 8-phosphate phosphatase (KDO 8-P phosphatase)
MIESTIARQVALVAFDVDGTLTDNGVYIGAPLEGAPPTDARVEFKRYDIQDGLGIVMLRRAGVAVAFISARQSQSTVLRAAELGVTHVHQGKRLRKVAVLHHLATELSIPLSAMAFMGDDLADIAAMQCVGLSAAPANAVPEVRDVATIRLTKSGGHGAVREFAELVLKSRGDWDGLVAEYVADSARLEDPVA